MSALTNSRPPESRVFLALLHRDLYVLWRDPVVFLGQVMLQPLFLLFVFGKVLRSLGYTQHGYSELLFPGLLSLTAVLTGMQTLALPLIVEFGWTKEVEDRLLAPVRTSLVMVEKVLFAALRALIAVAIMIPVGILVLGSVPWRGDSIALFLVVLCLACLLGAGMGLVLGTLVTPNRISIVFTLLLTPMLFTGCSQYPWPSLSRLPWFQALTALNPMTYASEGLRAALVPGVPHMHVWICLCVLLCVNPALLYIGRFAFYRRALD